MPEDHRFKSLQGNLAHANCRGALTLLQASSGWALPKADDANVDTRRQLEQLGFTILETGTALYWVTPPSPRWYRDQEGGCVLISEGLELRMRIQVKEENKSLNYRLTFISYTTAE